jgi:hypothetical protein
MALLSERLDAFFNKNFVDKFCLQFRFNGYFHGFEAFLKANKNRAEAKAKELTKQPK